MKAEASSDLSLSFPGGMDEAQSVTMDCMHTINKSLQSCLTLCDPMDSSPPVSSVHGVFQARILGWVAIHPPGDLPDPGMEPGPPALQADSLPSEPLGVHNLLNNQMYLINHHNISMR